VRGYAEARHEAVTGTIVMDGWVDGLCQTQIKLHITVQLGRGPFGLTDSVNCSRCVRLCHDRSCDGQFCCKLRGDESPSSLISECTYIVALVPTRGSRIRCSCSNSRFENSLRLQSCSHSLLFIDCWDFIACHHSRISVQALRSSDACL
jgi:hypothetical protein